MSMQEAIKPYLPQKFIDRYWPRATGRTWAFLGGSFVFWLFANQTQIGWLYVVSAVLTGLVFAGYALSRVSVDGIQASRLLTPDTVDLHENDEISITLALHPQRRPALHLNITEDCPIAPPESDERHVTMFAPYLPAPAGLQFEYAFPVYRRGVYHFPPVKISSRAPFGLFKRETELPVKTSLLIYPELRKLKRFPLLDRRLAAELANPRTGIGTEVVGVRPYRPGDSPRHIHWRSVARTNRLISKEFAEETQPGLTLILDRHCPLAPLPETKHTPFEMGVKCAVSIAEYAIRRGYPLHLQAATDDMAAPAGEVTLEVLLQYMARVQPQNNPVLPELLKSAGMQQYVAVVMSWPNVHILEPLLTLQAQGAQIMVILPDAASFPIEGEIPNSAGVTEALRNANIAVKIITHDTDWSLTLGSDADSD